jgi:hypothetical protein
VVSRRAGHALPAMFAPLGAQAPPGNDLDHAREKLTCRVLSGASYNLSVGNQGFDGSDYFAPKWGDGRVVVTSAVAGDSFDRAPPEPPVKPCPSPAT